MPYSVPISGLDLAGNLGDVRVTAGFAHTTVGPGGGEQRQPAVTQDIPGPTFGGGTAVTFSYQGNLAPPPSPTWDIVLSIQEVAGINSGRGWLFRSERLQTEPPSDPLEVIIAPEQTIGPADLAAAVGSLPMVSGNTTITGLTLTIVGTDIALTATGSDTSLPAGVTFTYSAILRLIPNGDHRTADQPFDLSLDGPSLTFTAGVGTGFITAILNLVSGMILNEVTPRLTATVRGRLNAGVLAAVATRLNRGVPAAMPAGVVLSIRRLRATTGSTAAGPATMIGVFAALGGFGGVLNKFPRSAGRPGPASLPRPPPDRMRRK